MHIGSLYSYFLQSEGANLRSSTMHADQYLRPNENEGSQPADTGAYEQYCLEQSQKARVLLGHPAALALVSSVAKDLAALVARYAAPEDEGTLSDVLADTVAEHVLAGAFKGNKDALHQPVSREGYRVIRSTVDRVCADLEAMLDVEAPK